MNLDTLNICTPNGPIDPLVCLAVAIFFAGGKTYDISVLFSISHTSVFDSLSCVINAINGTEAMDIIHISDGSR